MALSKGKRRLVERLLHPRFREREEKFLVEGVRAAGEIVEGDRKLEILLALLSPRSSATAGGLRLLEALAERGVPTEEVSDGEMAALSDTERHQGILLVVDEPAGELETLALPDRPRLLLLDRIQDPGNAGTLIRSAQVFGVHGVIALDGTVDPFNPKAVRASAGAVAHLPVLRASWASVLPWLRDRGPALLVADASGEDVRSVSPPPAWALAVGNEGAGPRPELLREADRVLAVSMSPGVGSLNAALAGGILLFALSAPTAGGGAEWGNSPED